MGPLHHSYDLVSLKQCSQCPPPPPWLICIFVQISWLCIAKFRGMSVLKDGFVSVHTFISESANVGGSSLSANWIEFLPLSYLMYKRRKGGVRMELLAPAFALISMDHFLRSLERLSISGLCMWMDVQSQKAF